MTAPAGSGVTNKGTTYADGSQVTSTNLNDIVDDAVFNTNAVDDSTIGLNSSTPKALFVKNQGIDTAQIKDDAVTTVKITNANVTTDKIADSNVTKAKIENVANLKVLGNTSGSAAAPEEVTINDTDNMSDASATTLATSESIKAYVDAEVANSFAPSIVFTSDARNSESQRYYKNLTEIDDPNSLITINGTSEIEFASTGTYMIEAGIGLDDNDGGSSDTYTIDLVNSNSSTTVISFQGISFQSWSLSKGSTENKLVTFQIPYTVSDTSTDKLAIYANPVSSASATQWEGFATIKITKIA